MKRNFLKDEAGALSIMNLVSALLLTVVGLALTPTVQESANSSINALGATSAAGSLVDLVPLFYVIIIIFGLVGYIVVKAKND